MSLPFYLTFVAACCIFTFGINGQSVPANSPQHPQNYLSVHFCPYSPKINCSSAQAFRSIDGHCTDANSPYSGKSETPYIRIVSAMYIDNKIPRNKSLSGQPLPGPRKISVDFFKETSDKSDTLSVMTPIFARFVEHDLYKTKLLDASRCCTSNEGDGVCDNIKVPTTDLYYKAFLKTCLPKGNMVPTQKLDCQKGGPPQQTNVNTHLLDLSNIYGSTKAASDRLRTKKDGLLKVSGSKDLLPKYAFSDCVLTQPNPNNVHCFDAGDLRVNIDPLIMTMYTIWVRHHNAIAKKLKNTLIHANDETIFQTARKIVIAQYQHIVYNELLPVFDKKTQLKASTAGTSSHTVDAKPTIFNSFSLVYTAIVDSMIPQQIKIGASTVPLDSVYYNPTTLFETDGITNILEAMQKENAEKIDRYMVKAITNSYLKKIPGSGTDKVALNLQQSRENGAPFYPVFYIALNEKNEGLSDIDPHIKDLKLYPFQETTVYRERAIIDIDDVKTSSASDFAIELLPGLFSEKLLNSDVVYGKTTQILMEKQFTALKEGDRFFYSHAGVFTTEQFTNIKKMTLAKILCNNGPLDEVIEHPLNLEVSTTNIKKPCNKITDIDICLWSTFGWSEWTNLGCHGKWMIRTRQCNTLVGSTCKCKGNPIEVILCSLVLSTHIVNDDTVNAIIDTFYKNFDTNGKPLDPNNTLNVLEILNGVTP